MERHYDSIIIGAGMSGLSAGIRLSHFGKRVCIVEKHSLWGGLNSFYKKEGRPFDVGLHAMTNYVPKSETERRGPLSAVCRQLRIDQESLDLKPQIGSRIQFPSASLRFSNELSLLESEVASSFPGREAAFRALCDAVRSYDDGTLSPPYVSTRKRLEEILAHPLLIEMILCPLMFYGSATAHDMDWHQFTIMFKAIFFDGFCRPRGGVRRILDVLKRKYIENGGELSLKTGVRQIVPIAAGRVRVIMDNGDAWTADTVFSSAGKNETDRLLEVPIEKQGKPGVMSFVETIFCLDQSAPSLGWNASILFFSHRPSFSYQRPNSLVDVSSGIVCCPENFRDQNDFPEGILRVTSIANYDKWKELRDLSATKYETAKKDFVAAQLDSISTLGSQFKSHIVYQDSFTPVTIEHFTSHDAGAVYGSPVKHYDGDSGTPNVYLIGTDQGYLGIVGALLSGVMVANRYGGLRN